MNPTTKIQIEFEIPDMYTTTLDRLFQEMRIMQKLSGVIINYRVIGVEPERQIQS